MCNIATVFYPWNIADPAGDRLGGDGLTYRRRRPDEEHYAAQYMTCWVSSNGWSLGPAPCGGGLWSAGEVIDDGNGGLVTAYSHGATNWSRARQEFITGSGCGCTVPHAEPSTVGSAYAAPALSVVEEPEPAKPTLLVVEPQPNSNVAPAPAATFTAIVEPTATPDAVAPVIVARSGVSIEMENDMQIQNTINSHVHVNQQNAAGSALSLLPFVALLGLFTLLATPFALLMMIDLDFWVPVAVASLASVAGVVTLIALRRWLLPLAGVAAGIAVLWFCALYLIELLSPIAPYAGLALVAILSLWIAAVGLLRIFEVMAVRRAKIEVYKQQALAQVQQQIAAQFAHALPEQTGGVWTFEPAAHVAEHIVR